MLAAKYIPLTFTPLSSGPAYILLTSVSHPLRVGPLLVARSKGPNRGCYCHYVLCQKKARASSSSVVAIHLLDCNGALTTNLNN